MTPRTRTPIPGSLPPDGAFVVQLQSDIDPAAGRVAGRVEHVSTGQASRFGSWPELCAFIERVLAATAANRPEAGSTTGGRVR